MTTFAKAAKDSHRKQQIDDWQIRVPTYTIDIAQTLVLISNELLGDLKHKSEMVQLFHFIIIHHLF